MVTCYYQYCNCRYHYLYIYTSCRPVCSAIYNEYCDHYADNTNVYSNRSAVSEQYCTNFTININEWHQRNMVTCYYQYCNCRYHYLYIYTSCRSVCSAIYNEYCGHYTDHTNVYAN